MPPSSLPNFFFTSLLSSIFTATFFTHSYSQCLDDQKSLLLELKNELIFNSSKSEKLVQWNQTDECCNWNGVECDGAGNVIGLQLDDEAISGGIGNSSSLFRLKYLEKLNMAYNKFNYTQIPRGIHNLRYLTHLNLSNACFGGQVPVELSLLRRLVSLDISNSFWNLFYYEKVPYYIWKTELLKLENPNLEMLVQNLTGLRELYLDDVDLSTVVPNLFMNFSSLTTLSLSNCSLQGSFPEMIFQIPTLKYLDLFDNELLSGTMPPFNQSGSLKFIGLYNCKFTGPIPSTLANLTKLIGVDLSDNLFTGSLSSTLFEGLSNLLYLDLGSNRLEGPIPHSIFQLQSLKFLMLYDNLFNGTTQSLVNLSDITELDLSSNRISGEIPSWIWGRQLQYLNLSHNLLTDLQKPYHIPGSLEILDLESNQLRGELHLPIPPNIVGDRTSHLGYLSAANNSLSGSIPTSLCNAAQLAVLHLSLNKLSGNIPPCLVENTWNLRVFDLGRNNISGRIPDKFSHDCNLRYFDLNNNTLEGILPKSLERCDSLEFMNVGNNIINDTFPCMLSPSLRVLVLHSNKFHGEVRCHNSWPDLQIVDISSNNFSGSLEPINFYGWRTMVLESEAQLSHDRSPTYFSVTLNMKGIVVEFVKILPDFVTIDFSCNNFQGEIPNAIGDLSSLHLLNLSHNALNGTIPKSFGKLGELESLDLSKNQLTGTIPEELARLTFLEFLNLSYNKLVGKIPNGRQLQTFSADSFKENPGLWGFPLNTDDNDLSPPEHGNVHPKREIQWEYVSVALGYVVGLGSVVWLLLFSRSFRDKYFGKIEEVVEDIFGGRNRRR